MEFFIRSRSRRDDSSLPLIFLCPSTANVWRIARRDCYPKAVTDRNNEAILGKFLISISSYGLPSMLFSTHTQFSGNKGSLGINFQESKFAFAEIFNALIWCYQELFGVMIMMQLTAGTNNVAEMQLNFWREKLPSVQVPDSVAASMSPLTQEEVNMFAKIHTWRLAFPCHSILYLCQFTV